MALVPASQAEHIKLNTGNVFAIGFLSLLWVGGAMWVSDYLAHVDVPVISQLAVGAKYFLRTP
jgi:hypothetical protein